MGRSVVSGFSYIDVAGTGLNSVGVSQATLGRRREPVPVYEMVWAQPIGPTSLEAIAMVIDASIPLPRLERLSMGWGPDEPIRPAITAGSSLRPSSRRTTGAYTDSATYAPPMSSRC